MILAILLTFLFAIGYYVGIKFSIQYRYTILASIFCAIFFLYSLIKTVDGYFQYFDFLNKKELIIDGILDAIENENLKKLDQYEKYADSFNYELMLYQYIDKHMFFRGIYVHNEIHNIKLIPKKEKYKIRT